MKVKHFIDCPNILKDSSVFFFLKFFCPLGFSYKIMPQGVDNILENISEVQPPSQLVQLARYDSVNAPMNS